MTFLAFSSFPYQNQNISWVGGALEGVDVEFVSPGKVFGKSPITIQHHQHPMC
jgi:hypothetical protein